VAEPVLACTICHGTGGYPVTTVREDGVTVSGWVSCDGCRGTSTPPPQ
jgi:hypothetical protein